MCVGGGKGTSMSTAYSISERGQEFPLGPVRWIGAPVTTEPTAPLFCLGAGLIGTCYLNP